MIGQSGAGKSSLLNALLDEYSMVPTSGIQGCTAAPIELRYNTELRKQSDGKASVYCARIEFIRLHDWRCELELLVDAICVGSNDDGTFVKPDSKKDAARAAWDKLEQVYGRTCLEGLLELSKEEVLAQLSDERKVTALLSRESLMIEHGQVQLGSPQAVALAAESHSNMASDLKAQKKAWAKRLSCELKAFVVKDEDRTRKGDGQCWPLVKKAVLWGPWPVLRSGACLVDLPGVKDTNSVRAKVAANYLPNCSGIWIVDRMCRATTNAVAKELLGEQFKRQLLMDGQYGNVTYICSATDECNPRELWSQLAEFAGEVPGRREHVQGLFDRLDLAQLEFNALSTEEESRIEQLSLLAQQLEETKKEAKKEKREREKAEKAWPKRTAEGAPLVLVQATVASDGSVLVNASTDVEARRQAAERSLQVYGDAKQEYEDENRNSALKKRAFAKETEKHERLKGELQRELNPLIAKMRNEYATQKLQVRRGSSPVV